jgi:hypothetical protein
MWNSVPSPQKRILDSEAAIAEIFLGEASYVKPREEISISMKATAASSFPQRRRNLKSS